MVFVITNIKEANIERAEKELMKEGWTISAFVDSDDEQAYTIEALKTNYTITESFYKSDTAKMKIIAKKYEAFYDGWFASN